MTESEEAAVCILGGGPAGATLAIRLAQLGHRVVLVECCRAPRRRVGESLSPGVWTQLDMLGARPAIENAGFPEFRRAVVDWESGAALTREFPPPPGGGPGLLVDRGRFDRLLLDVARAHGVRVLHPAAIRECRRGAEGWRLELDTGDRHLRVDAEFLALAGGRAASSRRTRRATGPRTLALHADWVGAGLPLDPRIEAGEDKWYWGMPLPDGGYSTMAFVDPLRFRGDRTGSLAAAYTRLIRGSKLLAGCRNAELSGPVRAADATPFVDDSPVGRHSIKVGEAALAIDPLSSSGVQRAIQGALAGAVVVNTLLRRPGCSAAALGFYRDSLQVASKRHQRWTAALYRAAAAGRDSSFWRDRTAEPEPEPEPDPAPGGVPHPQLPVALAPDIELVATPCVVGDFVAMRRALRHPRLAEPVAYFGGQELAPLLEQLRPGMTALELVQSWSGRGGVAPRVGIAIVGWMLEMGVLVAPPHRQREGAALSNVVV